MGQVNQYEVYYRININNYPDRDDVPQAGKLIVKKAIDESDAKERATNIISEGLDINVKDLKITDVLFWDYYYD